MGGPVPGNDRSPAGRWLAGLLGWNRTTSVLVRPEVEVVQGHGLAATELVVVGVVARDGVRRGAGLLGGLHPDVAVPLETGTGRDQLADDHVLLQTAQRVRTTVDGGVGE